MGPYDERATFPEQTKHCQEAAELETLGTWRLSTSGSGSTIVTPSISAVLAAEAAGAER